MKELNEIALGPNGSYLVVYTKQDGTKYVNRWGIPESLRKWLVPIEGKGLGATRNLSSLRCSLGPDGSYFAFDKNGATWADIPAPLEEALKNKLNEDGEFKQGIYPQSVALGANGTYVMTTVGGGALWHLKGTQDVLENYLKKAKLGSLKGEVSP